MGHGFSIDCQALRDLLTVLDTRNIALECFQVIPLGVFTANHRALETMDNFM